MNPIFILVKQFIYRNNQDRILILFTAENKYYILVLAPNNWNLNKHYLMDEYKNIYKDWYYNSNIFDNFENYNGDSMYDRHHSMYPGYPIIYENNTPCLNNILHILHRKRIISIEVYSKDKNPFYTVIYKCLETHYDYYDLKKIITIQRFYKHRYYKIGGRGYLYCKNHFSILQ